MIGERVRQEIVDFVAAKAPGLEVSFTDNPAFDSTTISIGLRIDLTKLVSNHTKPETFGALTMEMLADVQKAAVTAIGLEEYVRSRQIEVLEDARKAVREQLGEIPGE